MHSQANYGLRKQLEIEHNNDLQVDRAEYSYSLHIIFYHKKNSKKMYIFNFFFQLMLREEVQKVSELLPALAEVRSLGAWVLYSPGCPALPSPLVGMVFCFS
jgi:hypothetical protein